MSEDYLEAIEISGMTEEEFFKWIASFNPTYRIKRGTDPAGSKYFDCVYTDGDSGVIVFNGFTEMFEHGGMRVNPVTPYCDMFYDSMACILMDMEELAEIADKHNDGIEI